MFKLEKEKNNTTQHTAFILKSHKVTVVYAGVKPLMTAEHHSNSLLVCSSRVDLNAGYAQRGSEAGKCS